MCSYNRSEAASKALHAWLVHGALRQFISQDNLESSFRHLKVVFELIRQISGNDLLKLTRYTGYITTHETVHTISLISPSKSSSSSNTSNSDSTPSILDVRETRFANGMARDRSDLSRSFRHQPIFKSQHVKFG